MVVVGGLVVVGSGFGVVVVGTGFDIAAAVGSLISIVEIVTVLMGFVGGRSVVDDMVVVAEAVVDIGIVVVEVDIATEVDVVGGIGIVVGVVAGIVMEGYLGGSPGKKKV